MGSPSPPVPTRHPPAPVPVTYLGEQQGEEKEGERVQRVEVGGHVRWQASESQESEAEG